MHLNLLIHILLQRVGSEKVMQSSIKCLTFTFCSELPCDCTAHRGPVVSSLEGPHMEPCPALEQQEATLNVFIYILFGITTGKWNARKWNLLKDYFIQACGNSMYINIFLWGRKTWAVKRNKDFFFHQARMLVWLPLILKLTRLSLTEWTQEVLNYLLLIVFFYMFLCPFMQSENLHLFLILLHAVVVSLEIRENLQEARQPQDTVPSTGMHDQQSYSKDWGCKISSFSSFLASLVKEWYVYLYKV